MSRLSPESMLEIRQHWAMMVVVARADLDAHDAQYPPRRTDLTPSEAFAALNDWHTAREPLERKYKTALEILATAAVEETFKIPLSDAHVVAVSARAFRKMLDEPQHRALAGVPRG